MLIDGLTTDNATAVAFEQYFGQPMYIIELDTPFEIVKKRAQMKVAGYSSWPFYYNWAKLTKFFFQPDRLDRRAGRGRLWAGSVSMTARCTDQYFSDTQADLDCSLSGYSEEEFTAKLDTQMASLKEFSTYAQTNWKKTVIKK